MSISAYEQVRLDNIRRNEEYLQEIGLSTVKKALGEKQATPPRVAKRKAVGEMNKATMEPQRRSSRIAELPAPELPAAAIDADDNDETFSDPDDDDEGGGLRKAAERSRKSIPAPRGPPAANSSRTLDAQLSSFLGPELGTLSESLAFGKLAVMVASNGGSAPKFSKYAGVVEWRNCLYLWVNIAGKDGYTNSFREQGRFVTWYGGSKMRPDSEMGARVLRAGSGECVVLFARLPGEAYTCLGRLGVAKASTDRHPVKVEFELLDYAALKGKEQFTKILRENSK